MSRRIVAKVAWSLGGGHRPSLAEATMDPATQSAAITALAAADDIVDSYERPPVPFEELWRHI